jgi:uncharacterized protein
MLTEPLPRTVNPAQLATEGRVLEGSIPISRLERLADYLSESEGEVQFRLRFKKRKDRRIQITGSVTATVTMSCQYCLKPVSLAIEAKIALLIVSDESNEKEAAQLESDLDLMLMEGDKLEVVDIIEDDLILSLPMVARHLGEDGHTACSEHLAYKGAGEEIKEDKPNPFAVLARLKDGNLKE